MEGEGLVVCCSHTALMLAKADPELIAHCVMSNAVPENEVYVIDKDEFMDWLKEHGVRGERNDQSD